MDQITYNVRRSSWLNIIEQCQSRPEGMTVCGKMILLLENGCKGVFDSLSEEKQTVFIGRKTDFALKAGINP